MHTATHTADPRGRSTVMDEFITIHTDHHIVSVVYIQKRKKDKSDLFFVTGQEQKGQSVAQYIPSNINFNDYYELYTARYLARTVYLQ